MGLRLTGMLALAGAILGFFVSLGAPRRYVAISTLRFIRAADAPRDLTGTVASRLFATETLAALIEREPNLKEMLTVYRSDEVFDIVRAGSRVHEASLPGGARGIEVTYEDEDAERALGIDRELALTAAKLTAANGREVAELLGTPRTERTGATAGLTTGVGLALGAATGLLAWAAAAKRQTLRPSH